MVIINRNLPDNYVLIVQFFVKSCFLSSVEKEKLVIEFRCSFLQKFETFQLFRRINFRFELILILASEKRLSYSDNDWSRLRTRNEFSLSRRGEGPLVRNRHQEGGKHWRFNKTSLVGNRGRVQAFQFAIRRGSCGWSMTAVTNVSNAPRKAKRNLENDHPFFTN